MSQRYLWRKQASHAWLRANEPELFACFAERVAIIERAGRERCTVEICCAQRREAERLITQLGGRVEKISALQPGAPAKPLKIGARLIVTGGQGGSEFPKRRHLVIPAEAAFGTGDHATTAMTLRLLERITRTWPSGWSLLDAGTGTGILALAGHLFGAAKVTALDNDAVAIATAKRNAIRNRIHGLRFKKANAVRIRTRGKFDLIVANLFSELLIKAIPNWRVRLKPTGILILSGILREQERAVVRALRKSQLAIQEIRRRGKWVSLCARVARASCMRMI